jgi:uncharacterized membrane protein
MPVQDLIQSEQSQSQSQVSESNPGANPRQSSDIWQQAFQRTSGDRLATFLGWFSVGLGAVELFAPKTLGRLIGAPHSSGMKRLMGLREIAVGAGILTAPRSANWIKARVAGDALDLALLGAAFKARRSDPARLAAATAAVVGVTAVDIACARQLSGAPAATMARAGNTDRNRIEASMAVNRSPQDCYRFWRDFENMARFIEHIGSVEILRDTPDQAIEWRSTADSHPGFTGSVTFEPRISGQGTMVRLVIDWTPPGGKAGAAAARLLRKIPEHQVREDLRRFKNVIETGEVPTTEGQPSGRSTDK